MSSDEETSGRERPASGDFYAGDPLRVSREHLELALDAGEIGAWKVNLKTRVWRTTHRYDEILGVEPGTIDWTTSVFESRVHPDDLQRFRDAVNVALKGGPYEVTLRVRLPNRRIRWIRERGRVLFDEGEPVYAIGVTTDITSERRLAAERTQFEIALENASDGHVLFDVEGRVLWANRLMRLWIGKSGDELSTLTVTDIAPSIPISRFRRIQAVASSQRFRPFETFIRRHDSHQFPAEVTATVIEMGDDSRLLASVRDITDRRSAETALRQRESQFRSIADTAPAMLWTTDAANECTFLSRAWHEYTGQLPHEGLGFGWLDAVHSDDRASAENDFLRAAEERVPLSLYLRFRTRSGDYRWCIDAARPRFDEQGNWAGYVGNVVDVHDHVEASQALALSEEKLRMALDASELGTWELDVATMSLHLDERSQSIYDAPPTLPAAELSERIHPTDQKAIQEGLGPSFDPAIRSHGSVEHRMQHADGSYRWLRAAGRVEFDDKGTPIRAIGTVQDIHDRKMIEEAVRQSEARYRTLFESIDEGFAVLEIIYDEAGKPVDYVFSEINPAFETHTGLVDAVGKRVSEMIPGLDPFWVETYGQVASSGEGCRFEHASRVMGREFEVEAFRVGSSDMNRVAVLFKDITPRRKAEAVLRLRERALASTPVGVVITDLQRDDWPIIYANKAFETLTGYDVDEVLGLNCRFLQRMPGGTLDRDQEGLFELRQAISERRSARVILRNYRKDGTLFFNRLGVSPVTDSNGEVTHYVGVQEDVTERIRYERDLLEAKLKAEEMARLKSAFLSNMSHEIRTPLTTIIGFAHLLAERVQDEHREVAQRIGRGGARLLETLNSVLDLAQLESGMHRLNLERVDVAAEIRSSATFFQSTIEAKGVQLEVALPRGPLLADVDGAAFRRVLANLISNASKFTDQGTIRLSAARRRGEIVIKVADTGVGMSDDFLPRVFEEFQQESTGMGRAYEGSGLGLSIVKRLLELMGGSIAVESEKSVGTTFTLRLPGAGLPDSFSAVTEDFSGPLSADLSILIVEDNAETRQLMEIALSGAGKICSAANVQDSRRMMNEVPFDVILADINLGSSESGLDLVRIASDNDLQKNAMMVAVTAYALPGDRERFLEAGFHAYLRKPFSLAELRETVLTGSGRSGA
jgi:PAS domain S-box-containing protein